MRAPAIPTSREAGGKETTDSRAKHTPGPWVLSEDERGTMFVRDANGALIWNSRRTTQRGNARLIATATELLTTLQLVLNGLRNGSVKSKPLLSFGPGAETADMQSLEEIVATILAKARGQS